MDGEMATRTQVAIIGGGPAGLLLSYMLHRNGIDSILLERQSRTHVLERIRAGVLEAGTVELLREVGLGFRMDREGHPHNGSAIAWEGRPRFFIDTKKLTGKAMMAYGQTAITEDLYAVRDAAGGQTIDEAGNDLHQLAEEVVGSMAHLSSSCSASPVSTRLRWMSHHRSRADPGNLDDDPPG